MDATAEEGAAAAAAVQRSCAANGGYSGVSLHVARLEDVYASAAERLTSPAEQGVPTRRAKLQALLQVPARTARVRPTSLFPLNFLLRASMSHTPQSTGMSLLAQRLVHSVL